MYTSFTGFITDKLIGISPFSANNAFRGTTVVPVSGGRACRSGVEDGNNRETLCVTIRNSGTDQFDATFSKTHHGPSGITIYDLDFVIQLPPGHCHLNMRTATVRRQFSNGSQSKITSMDSFLDSNCYVY